MANDNATPSLPIAGVFSRLFHGFPKLLFTNVLFAVPAAVFLGVFYAVNTLTGWNLPFILMLAIIPAAPFYAGVVKVALGIATGEENIDVFRTFKAAVKENFGRFLIHGLLFFIAVFFSSSSISIYFQLGRNHSAYYAAMATCILIAIVLMFFFFYVPLMTVTFDLSMGAIYRNSLLMSFGELKSNLIATFGLFLLMVICSSVLMCCGGNVVALMIATVVLGLLVVPSVAAFIINSAVYKRMFAMVTDKSSQGKAVDKKIEEKRLELEQRKKATVPVDEELKKLEIDESADGDEYIYYKGKMVKRSVLRRMKQEAEEGENQ